MADDEEQVSHEMVMPFVSVASKGGPFDDAAFTAGYEMGLLDAVLGHAYTFGLVDRTLRAENRAQADLIAMRHGWRARFTVLESDEWVGAEFLRLDPNLDKPPT